MFRSSAKLNTTYARQKLLLALEGIVAEEVEASEASQSVQSSRRREVWDGLIQRKPAAIEPVDYIRVWLNREASQKSRLPTIFQVLKAIRFQISKYLNETSCKRYSKTELFGLNKMLLACLFKNGQPTNSFEVKAADDIQECLDTFLNRSVKSQRGRLFEEVDDLCTQVIYEQKRLFDCDVWGSEEDDDSSEDEENEELYRE